MWSRRKTRLDRIACAALAFLFAVMNIINPLVIMPAYADGSNMVQLSYQYEEKPEVEILVRSEHSAILPGDETALHITVRNNTDSVLPHGILTWEDKTNAFSEAEFVLLNEADDSAAILEDGSAEGIFLEVGETYEIAFRGTLREDLDGIRKETLGLTFKADKADGSSVEASEDFRYQVGFACLAPVGFADGNEIAAGETGAMTLQLNMEEIEIVTASNSNTATDSDADAFLTADRITYTVETFGAKLKNISAAESTANGTAVSTDVEFEVAENTEPGVYFGKVTAEVKVGSKNYTLTQGFAVEVTGEETGYPAFRPEPYYMSNGVVISLYAEAGVLPKGTTAEIKEVTAQVEDAVKEAVSQESNDERRRVTDILAYDIALYDAEGNKLDDSWSENGTVEVTFSGDGIAEKSKYADAVDIRHIKTDADLEGTAIQVEEIESIDKVVETIDVPQEERIDNLKFEAEHFSIYAPVFFGAARDDEPDKPMIRVEKVFSGITKEKIDLLDDFTITVKNSTGSQSKTLTLTDNPSPDMSVDENGNIRYVWGVEDLKGGTYQVSENEAEIDGYTLQTNGLGKDVTIKEADLRIQCVAAVPNCNLHDYSVGKVGMIAAILTDGRCFVWTKDQLSEGERLKALSTIHSADMDFKNVELENCIFYSGDNIADDDGLNFRDGQIKYDKENNMHFDYPKQWTKFMTGDYERAGVQSAEITITNTYTPNYKTIQIKKTVSGNMGDWQKDFQFTISPEDGYISTVPGIVDENGSFTLKHGETIEFQVKVGSTITVSENPDGYEAEYKVNGTENTKGSKWTYQITPESPERISVEFINTKNAIIDTGVILDSLPYFLILGAAAAGIVFYAIRKRKESDLD